jgi:hypothetical protein
VILDFQSNCLTTVEPLKASLWRVFARFDDNLFSVDLTLDVAQPALDIRNAQIGLRRDILGAAPDLKPLEEKLKGVRIGPGMTKIVRGLVGGEGGSDRLSELILDSMEMLINALTVPELRKGAQMGGQESKCHNDGPRVYLNDVLVGEEVVKLMAGNPRLKDSCAAFKDLD